MNKKLVVTGAMSLALGMMFARNLSAEEAKPVVAATVQETAPDVAPQVLGDVVVSASRIAQSSIEAPSNVAVFTASKINKTNSQRLGDVMVAKVPGMYLRGGAMGSSKPGTTAVLSMRGQNGRVAVLVDGMNMADAYSGAINWAMVSMDDVERVEVVPGANSTLYGSNAMGGLISVTTKAPTKKEMDLKIGKGGGDSGGKYASAMYRNKFENGLGIVFGVSEKDRDGYAADYVTKTPSGVPAAGAVVVNGAIQTTTNKGATTYIVGDMGKTASTQKNAQAKLYFDLSPSAKIFGGFAWNENRNRYEPYHSYLTNAATGSPIPITATATNLSLNGLKTSIQESNFYGNSPFSGAKRYFGGYDGEVFGDSKLSVNIGQIVRDYGYALNKAGATLTSGAGTLSTTPNTTTNAGVQLSRPLGERQFLIVGLATEMGKLNQKKYNLSNWSDTDSRTTVIDQVDADSTTRSLFVQDQVEAGKKLTLYVGGRYDAWKAGATAAVITPVAPNVASTTVFADRNASAFSPKLAAVYKLRDNLSIKSSVGSSFTAPKNIYLFANPSWNGGIDPAVSRMTKSNPDLKPEKARSFDLGLEFNFADGGDFKAAYFVTTTTDLIYSKDTTLATPYLDPVYNKIINTESTKVNAGKGLARGIELSGAYPVLRWLTLSGSYGYTDARITADATNSGMVGKFVTNVPKNTASLALEAAQGDWSGALSARYVGLQYTSNDNSDVVKDVWTGYSIYTVGNLKVGYRMTKHFKLNFMVDNLTDRKYYEYYVQPGRSASLEIVGNY
jgi:iron complex outermembrane receptor protein